MNIQLQQKMNQFREKWTRAELWRPKIRPGASDEERKAGDEIQRKTNEQMYAAFKAQFTADEIEQIRTHLDENLRPQVVPAEPRALAPHLPVHEVAEDTLNEYYFFRTFL
jgi:hypothetical protein